jgi:PAS domain S-box-containing protein/diguanylate cyclase (GGDEF)-like protein
MDVLQETEQRPKELTAGEADTVVDRDGRTFSSRRAQERLCHTEAGKQAAIINALPAHIALLDTQGIIVSVNEAWRRFAGANVLQSPAYGIGLNYLEICDRARGDNASEAHRVADGVRSVLSGAVKNFSLEYPCHSPTEQRWFLLTVIPLADDRPNGAVVMHLNVTEGRRTAESLRISEWRFRQMADNIRDVFFLIDAESLRPLYISPAYEEIWGRSCESGYANPESWTDAIHPDDRASTYEKYKKGMSAGKFEYEYRIVRPDGSIRWMEDRCFPIRDDAGKVVRVAGVAEDITERKQIEEALRESEERFAGAFEFAPIGVALVSPDGRWLKVNRVLCDLVGYSEAELLSRKFQDITHPEDLEADLQNVRRLIAGEIHAYQMEKRYVHARGHLVSVLLNVSLVRDGQGQPLYFISQIQDITERKQAADGLRESKNLLQSVVEHVPARIFWKGRDLRYLGCNTQFAKDAGHSRPDELTGKTDFEMGWKDQAELYRGDDKAVLDSGTSKLDIEEPQTAPDGNTIWLRTSKVPLRDKDNQIIGILGLYQDITAGKKAAQELRESERRFSDMLGNVELVAMMLDREARITYCNDYLLRLTGWRREEVIGRDWFELFVPPEFNDLKENFFATFLANLPEALHPENEILTRSGERRLIRWNNSVLRSGAGDVIGTASIGEDITERKEAEDRIAVLNRVYAMLSGINTLIVRVRDRDELFREACRIAVVEGGFRMSLIGMVDRSAMTIVPVASAGKDEELLSAIKGLVSSREISSNTMVARAIREKRAVVSNDSQNDPQVLLGNKYAEAGVRSMAILPLMVSDEAIGALALYSGKTEFFHEGELNLLTDLAGDIAFAIDHIDKQERLDYLAYYDALTGLANRALFHERLQQSVVNAHEQRRKLALVLLDIERFKTINDTLGRPAGDALLKELAARLSVIAVDVGRLGRIDADHFALMVPDVQSGEELARLIEQRVGEVFRPPFRIGDAELRVSARFGIAMFPGDGADADALFRNAEAALKNAKAKGERYLFYTQTMNERVAEKLSLENNLRQALDKGEFVLHYQPKVNLASGKLTSAEALIRWNDPRTGLVPPLRFIPILEETGLIHEVGRWALGKAIEDYLRWRAAGLAAVRIAVNVSPLQLRNRGFIAEIEQAISIDANAAAGLELEITESLIMEDVKHSIASLQAIRAIGVTIAIDDFGTGFSSLSYLSKLPVDTLKIDRSFVINMTAGPQGLALVSTIINLAHALNLKVVAEGVETEEQLSLLRLLNCDEMQGYLFSKPVPVEIFETRFLAPPLPG